MKAKDIQYALTRRFYGVFPCRTHVVVPNVSWGWNLNYEADLIVISKANICTEIEIKISKADFDADKNKGKWVRPQDPRIQKFYFAVPEELVEHVLANSKPEQGVISVSIHPKYRLPQSKIVRKAVLRPNTRKPREAELQKILHLGNMRYWSIFEKERLKQYGEAEIVQMKANLVKENV